MRTAGRFARLSIAVALSGALLASDASAAIPGRNGAIAFNAGSRIAVGTPDTSPLTAYTFLTPAGSPAGGAAWSPDGTRVAYADHRDVWVVDHDGTNPRRVTDLANDPPEGMSPAFAQNADWSPDGAWIIFDNQRGVWKVPADGSAAPTLIYSAGGAMVQTPTWSPDGSRIAFSGVDPATPNDTVHFRIYSVRPDGTGVVPVTTPPPDPGDGQWVIDLEPDYSPGGSRIVFSRFINGVSNHVLTIATDGTGETNITDSDPYGGQSPTWSPDGTRIAFSRRDLVMTSDTDGSNVQQLTTFDSSSPVYQSQPDWQPVAPNVRVTTSGDDVAQHGDGPVTLTYRVRNDGLPTLQNVSVTSTHCPSGPTRTDAGTGGDELLTRGEVWDYTCQVTIPAHDAGEEDPIADIVDVTAQDADAASTHDDARHTIDIVHALATLSQAVEAGSTIATDPPSPSNPIGVAVTAPTGLTASGTVSITTYDGITQALPTSPTYTFLDYQVVVEAPSGTFADPLTLKFVLYGALAPEDLVVFRNGVAVAGTCPAEGTELSEPCVKSITPTGDGNTEITVLTDHASAWNFADTGDGPPPSISITRPATNDRYLLGQSVTASYSCFSIVSPVTTCAGPVSDGAQVPTGLPLGSRTFTVSAATAGGTETASTSYAVLLDFGGFASPVDARPTVNAAKAGSAIPVRFALRDANGASAYPSIGLSVFASGSPTSRSVDCLSGAPVDAVEETFSASSSSLTYDRGNGVYQYAWKTDRTWRGKCRRLIFTLADGEVYTAEFKFAG